MNTIIQLDCYIASTIKRIPTYKFDYFDLNLLYLRDVFELSLIVLFNEFTFFTLFASMQLVAEIFFFNIFHPIVLQVGHLFLPNSVSSLSMRFNVIKETKICRDGPVRNRLNRLESISILEYTFHSFTTASSTGTEGHLRPPLSFENIKP